MMKIIFVNHFHNGDIHLSRTFVRKIIEKIKSIRNDVRFEYSHYNDPCLLSDIPDLVFNATAIENVNKEDNLKILTSENEDTVYINTWYAQQDGKYIDIYGTTIDTLYVAFNDTCKKLSSFSLSDISDDIIDFFPVIDYTKFNTENITSWLNEDNVRNRKKILVENSPAKSGQSLDFDMALIISEIAKSHLDKIFILSTRENIEFPQNVIYTDDIIKKESGSDLNEISFLSTHCDMIIGKASGVFSFTITKQNLFDRKVKYLCFANIVYNKLWLGNIYQDKINYSADITIVNEPDIPMIYRTIEESLNGNL